MVFAGINAQRISIHALREEGDPKFKYPKQPDLEISIHALREEGDTQAIVAARKIERFLSTPSARRATIWPIMIVAVASFLSTPSARRATPCGCTRQMVDSISIHALREEGDLFPFTNCNISNYFYPRPPRGGRRTGCGCGSCA